MLTFQSSDGKNYDLLSDEEDDDRRPSAPTSVSKVSSSVPTPSELLAQALGKRKVKKVKEKKSKKDKKKKRKVSFTSVTFQSCIIGM